jgi:hypothetical protein
MSYEFYKVLHFIGIFLILISLGGIIFQMISGASRTFTGRKLAAALHGAGLLIVFIAGFGLMAKLGLMASWPSWIFGKLAIWLALGLMPLPIYRAPKQAKIILATTLIIAAIAACLATFKPGAPSSGPSTPTTPVPSSSPNP